MPPLPDNVTYVGADLQTTDLASALREFGYDFAKRSIVITEGLTMYLREESLRETVALVALHPPDDEEKPTAPSPSCSRG